MTASSSPPSLWLPRHVYAARLDEDLVFLDASAEAYSCLPGAAEGLRLHATGEVDGLRRGLADELIGAGLLLEHAPAAEPRITPPRVEGSLMPDTPTPATLRSLSDLGWVTVEALRHYRGRGFADILAAAGPFESAALAEPSEDLERRVAAFHGWLPYAPLSGKCLLRSFLLRQWLRRQGHATLWVFGVALWPFRAHCWLQRGGHALDDTRERLQAFTPILTV